MLKEVLKEVNESEQAKYQPGKSVLVSQLKVGQKYFASYKNMGYHIELFTFTGFSDAEVAYGESGPKFKTIKDAKSTYGLKTMKDIDNMDSTGGRKYGQSIRMCGKWDDKTEGCYYYVCRGSWSRGSGCDKLSFSQAIPVSKSE